MIVRLAAALLIAGTFGSPLGAQEFKPSEEARTTAESARLLIGEPAGRPLTGAELTNVTEEVASKMRCPVCQGLSVADSPTPTALAMQEEVRRLLAAGFSRQQALAYFERSYGEFIRLEPKPEGFNLTVWILPILGLLTGSFLVFLRLRRGKVSGDPSGAEEPTVGEDLEPYLERVRREVAS